MHEGTLITLHYRIALEDGSEVLSTFGGNPATLALGRGELAPALERCLAHAREGETSVFRLKPGEAFGERREDMLQSMHRHAFPPDMDLRQGSVLEFSDAAGANRAGLVQAVEDDRVEIDFNHPLAGKAVRFEVRILGRAETGEIG